MITFNVLGHVCPVQEHPPLQEEDSGSDFVLITAEQRTASQTQELKVAREEIDELFEEIGRLTVKLIDDRTGFEELTQALLTQIDKPGMLAVAVDQPSTSTVNVSGDDGIA